MYSGAQPELLPASQHIVNVASVPHRSVFRYPGGKTWLIPRIRRWLAARDDPPEQLIEPFVGGGIVSLTAVAEGLVDRALIVELDPDVASVWETLCSGQDEDLCRLIAEFEPTTESVAALIAKPPRSTLQRAFATIVKNRTYHGGIIARGSSPMTHGENGRGIGSRWYPDTLIKRIRGIVRLRDRLAFLHGDGLAVLEEYAQDSSAVFFIDPPYTAAGKRSGSRLYTHSELDHERLFELTADLAGDFLMTYDNAEGVRQLAQRWGFRCEAVAMKNTHNAAMSELLIGPG